MQDLSYDLMSRQSPDKMEHKKQQYYECYLSRFHYVDQICEKKDLYVDEILTQNFLKNLNFRRNMIEQETIGGNYLFVKIENIR